MHIFSGSFPKRKCSMRVIEERGFYVVEYGTIFGWKECGSGVNQQACEDFIKDCHQYWERETNPNVVALVKSSPLT